MYNENDKQWTYDPSQPATPDSHISDNAPDAQQANAESSQQFPNRQQEFEIPYSQPQFAAVPPQPQGIPVPSQLPNAQSASQPHSNKRSRKKESNKGLGFGKLVIIALCCSLFGGILGVIGGSLLAQKLPPVFRQEGNVTVQEGQRENTVIDITKIDTSKLMTPAEVYAANVNSTVGITTSITTNFWGYQTTSAASGSGFIISKDGYILTNHHVIEGSDAITVSFYDGSSKEAALIGYDASNDIAVLKVEATDLTPVVLGDSNNLNVGDTVLAIGNPLGELTFSLTVGAVSAMEREITTSTGVTMDLMQTDCAINSGNSGGALFNLYGEVIGITNAKYSSNGSSTEASIDNIGFAIPINNVRSIVTSIIEKGYISKPYIGVSIIDVGEESQSYGLPKGAAVKQIVADSPAEKSGLQVNDIITHVNGSPINGASDLVKAVDAGGVGHVLKMTIYRQGTTIELELTIGEQIQQAIQEESQQQGQQQEQTPGSLFPFPFWNFGS